ncbi:MAG: glycosyltransferase family 4 protein [Oscillospiraceae bacterium]|nr:glycosyltransferase family 4 protein [Oscillospiraceae bacterium]MBQ8769521.1 glycosyltransferase family 4 protein [Oscillospiraceae bacterium]
MKKICFITTVSLTMRVFVVETAKYLHEQLGWDVSLICSPDEEFAAGLPEYLHYIPVKMNRGMDLTALRSIRDFIRVFRREKFDMVQYSTPNAACYASIAAKKAKVPVRLYAQWGIRYTGLSGLSRKIFRAIEKMVCRNSTHVRSVSPMNREFGIAEGLYPANKVSVVGNGGTIGVDMENCDIGKKQLWRDEIRSQHGLAESDFVFGFSGRISADKGCAELLSAFRELTEKNPAAKLLIVGPMDEDCNVDKALITWAKASGRVVFAGYISGNDMRKYYAAMDVLVHPTYREGFGMVLQEAGALGVPAITTRIIGASEVMVDGQSCLLVEPKDAADLARAMEQLCRDGELASRLSQAAYERTKTRYARPIMLENQKADYVSLLGEQ